MMNMQKLFLIALAIAALPVLRLSASMNEQAARQKALSVVRPKLSYLRPGQFLDIQRNERLEQKLAVLVGGLVGSKFIYRVSPEGDEIQERAVVHHVFTDIDDPVSLVAVSPFDGSTYLVRGFAESKADFNRLMSDLKVKISSPDQAEALADFYREVNPERRQLAPANSLLDLKQSAERQCQHVPFNADEKGFEAWWKHAKGLYSPELCSSKQQLAAILATQSSGLCCLLPGLDCAGVLRSERSWRLV